MKLKDIQAGTRAIKVVPLPLVKPPESILIDIPEVAAQRAEDMKAAVQPGQAPPAVPDYRVGLRVLTGEDTETVCEKAWAWAKAKGATSPDETDPIYSMAVKVYTCAVACVDPDNTDDLFFGDDVDLAAANLRASQLVGRDGIVYLAEQHETWQELCSPQIAKLSPEEFMRRVREVAASTDASPFVELQPGLRAIFARTMACALVDLLTLKSQSGGPSGSTTSAPPETLEAPKRSKGRRR